MDDQIRQQRAADQYLDERRAWNDTHPLDEQEQPDGMPCNRCGRWTDEVEEVERPGVGPVNVCYHQQRTASGRWVASCYHQVLAGHGWPMMDAWGVLDLACSIIRSGDYSGPRLTVEEIRASAREANRRAVEWTDDPTQYRQAGALLALLADMTVQQSCDGMDAFPPLVDPTDDQVRAYGRLLKRWDWVGPLTPSVGSDPCLMVEVRSRETGARMLLGIEPDGHTHS